MLTASDGNEALRIIQSEKLDLILLDYNMPEMSGGEILKKMRELKIDTKVIVVTGMETEIVINETKDYGIQECVHKPLDLAGLEKIVRAQLNP